MDGGPGEGDPWADYQRPVPAEESVDGVADAWGEPLNGPYDDPAVPTQKALYIRGQGLRGAMIWSLDGDDGRPSLTRTLAALVN